MVSGRGLARRSTSSAPCARVSAMPFAPESTTTVPVPGQDAPTPTRCTSSPPAWTLLAVVSATWLGPQRMTGVFGSACPTSRMRTSSPPAGSGVSASPLAPVSTHGVFGAALPSGMICTSSPAAVELAMPSGPVSTTIAPAPWHALPTGISWRSSPAAAVFAIRSGPQRISSWKGVPCPTAVACRSSPRAFVWQMPFAPESTSTALCSPVPGAIAWRSAWAADARSSMASIERWTFMSPSSSALFRRHLYEERHAVKRRSRRLRPRAPRQRAARSPHPRHREAGAVEKLPVPSARRTHSCAPRGGPVLDDAHPHATSRPLGPASARRPSRGMTCTLSADLASVSGS